MEKVKITVEWAEQLAKALKDTDISPVSLEPTYDTRNDIDNVITVEWAEQLAKALKDTDIHKLSLEPKDKELEK